MGSTLYFVTILEMLQYFSCKGSSPRALELTSSCNESYGVSEFSNWELASSWIESWHEFGAGDFNRKFTANGAKI